MGARKEAKMEEKRMTPCQRAQELLDNAQYSCGLGSTALRNAFYLGAIAGIQALGFAVHETDEHRHIVTVEEAL